MRLVKNYAEIETALAENPKTLCILTSIEGTYSLYNARALVTFLETKQLHTKTMCTILRLWLNTSTILLK